MKGHLYRFTIEHIEDAKGNAMESAPLTFETRNHDDLFKLVEMMKGRMGLSEADSTALTLGVKLFGEVMLTNRNHDLFKAFMPHFSAFMKELKTSA